MPPATPEPITCFVSYTGRDKPWAEWIAWQVEHAGHRAIIQAWDFKSGGVFPGDMHRALQQNARVPPADAPADAPADPPAHAAASGENAAADRVAHAPSRVADGAPAIRTADAAESAAVPPADPPADAPADPPAHAAASGENAAADRVAHAPSRVADGAPAIRTADATESAAVPPADAPAHPPADPSAHPPAGARAPRPTREGACATQAEIDRALRSLVNRSLVVPSDELQAFTLVPLVADFLRVKKADVVAETGDRLEERAYALIMENGCKKHDRFPALEAAWPGIAPALDIFLGGDHARLQTVCEALQVFLHFQGRWDEGLALCEKAEARAVAAADHDKAGWRAYEAGWIHDLRQQSDAVLACADRAAAHWERAFPPGAGTQAGVRERALAIRLRGIGHELKRDYPAAIAAYRESLDLRRSLATESEDVANGLNDLAAAEQLSGDFAAAEGHYGEALRVARAVDDAEGVAIYTGNLADLALAREDWLAAEALAREALPLSQAVHRQELIAGNNYRLAKALVRQAKVSVRHADGFGAIDYARRAVEIFTRLGSPDLEEARATLRECEEALK